MQILNKSNFIEVEALFFNAMEQYYKNLYDISKDIFYSNSSVHMGNILNLIKDYQFKKESLKDEKKLKYERSFIRSLFIQKEPGYTDLILINQSDFEVLACKKIEKEISSFLSELTKKVNTKLKDLVKAGEGVKEISIVLLENKMNFAINFTGNNNLKFKMRVKPTINYKENNILTYSIGIDYYDVYDLNGLKVIKPNEKKILSLNNN